MVLGDQLLDVLRRASEDASAPLPSHNLTNCRNYGKLERISECLTCRSKRCSVGTTTNIYKRVGASETEEGGMTFISSYSPAHAHVISRGNCGGGSGGIVPGVVIAPVVVADSWGDLKLVISIPRALKLALLTLSMPLQQQRNKGKKYITSKILRNVVFNFGFFFFAMRY